MAFEDNGVMGISTVKNAEIIETVNVCPERKVPRTLQTEGTGIEGGGFFSHPCYKVTLL